MAGLLPSYKEEGLVKMFGRSARSDTRQTGGGVGIIFHGLDTPTTMR